MAEGRLRVAGLQLSPVWLNKKATVEKVTNSRKIIFRINIYPYGGGWTISRNFKALELTFCYLEQSCVNRESLIQRGIFPPVSENNLLSLKAVSTTKI